ncbi:LysR family transcriptional regulator [Companilactobacillus allii]|uniref:LysR family transcriptional regulator n=1 Tax=Companilactobacillus allii TaxID=1847728 RepID=A0A1P8Q1N6_9LACO|nr:LysR family transcriptional regulator [Companilactobacillus allii]APX71737.1 LysR family transcriptional regulator [Companilactobacillus allii]USQ68824.1 LysR family transcriptional regulator [Companilactobacillus allii]
MFQQMKYFISIVKNHSFTKASVECNISQSAISQQMKELEAKLGVKLLNRKGRSFEVTKAGQYFYTHSQDILEDVTQLVDNTVKIVKDDQAEIKVGYLNNFGTSEFLQTVAQFSREFPQVQIKIKSGNHEQLYNYLRSGQIDLNFADQRRALSNQYINTFLTDSKYMLALSKTFFPEDIDSMDISELADISCIIISDDDKVENDKEYYQEILGVRSDFTVAKNYDEAQILVASNQGYLIINDRTMKQLDSSIVRTINLINGKQQMIQKYYAYWRADNSGYYIESFAKLLKDRFA